MIHHPDTIRGLHAQRDNEAREDKPAQPDKFASHKGVDLGGNHSEMGACSTFGARVAKWFDDRKITENGSLLTQYSKLREEVEELRVSIIVENDGDPIKIIDFKDAIGDCAVVLAGMAHMAGMTFEECCEHAWNEIKDRTGHLNKGGVFVKDLSLIHI